jgi:hypothetical protein
MPAHECSGRPEECDVTPGMCLFGSSCVGNQATSSSDEIVCQACFERYGACQKCGQDLPKLVEA